MSFNPQNPNGQASSANSAPVVLSTTQEAEIGIVTETAPATDTASSGLNGRLQRVAQRLTSLIGVLPTALVGGRLDTNIGSWLGSTAPTVGQKTMANGLPVSIASDQSVIPVSQSTAAATTAGWPMTGGTVARSATSWTSATSLDSTALLTVTGYGVCLITVNTPGTLTGGGIIFEGSDDGTTWFSVAAVRVESSTIETSFTLTASLKRAWVIPCSGFSTIRVRLNPVITGAGTTTVAMSAAANPRAMQPVVASALPLPTGASTETTLGTRLSESDFDTKTGSLTETAPGTDTASSGLNGRLQRVAQRLTSLIALLPSSLGQKTMANSLAVTLASDQSNLPASVSRQTFTAAPVVFTATTAVTSILAADASFGLDLVSLTIENNSATATEVVLYKDDGTTEVWRGYVPAGDMRGIVFPAGRELTQAAVNKAWKAKTVTSVSSVYITPHYIKNTAWAV